MKYKKNKNFIFYIFNAIILLLLLLLAIPASNFLSKINFSSSDLVKNQVIINPEAKSPKILDRQIEIKFIAKVEESLNWQFKPLQDSVTVNIGSNKTISYEGTNISNSIVTSTADFIATPETILPYIIKTECFCFTQQTLKPGESKIFTMVFYIDPSLDSDKNYDELKELVFTYEFSEYKS
tara:strand:+ start:2351 stop:2893 length:543 start_codon:yes stop_codon:yes gene_type:complete